MNIKAEMFKRVLLALWLYLFTALNWTLYAVEIKSEISRDKIYLGESFVLQISINGCSELNNVSFENAKDCQIKQLGSQKFSNYSVSIVNGKVTRQEFSGIVASYEITPNKSGVFDVGNITIEADGRKYKHRIPTVIVTDIEQQDVVKISIAASQDSALIDEPFEITLSILIKRLKDNMAHLDPIYSDMPPHITIPWLDDQKIATLKGPDIQGLLNQLLVTRRDQAGFHINNYTIRSDPFGDPFDFSSFFEPKKARFILPRKIVETNGISYFEYSIQFKYSSKEEGTFVFGPVVFKGDVPTIATNETKVNPFRVFAVGKAATVRVIPPPEEGRPQSFIGAIGSNMFLKATLDMNECYVGDPIKLTLTLTGSIRFDKVFPPFITNQTSLTELFTIYEDSLKIERSDNAIQFSYIIRPKKEGSYVLPPIEMAYFDTKERSYKKVFSEEIPITVRRGAEVTAKEIIASSNLMQVVETTKKDPSSLPVSIIKKDIQGISNVSFMPERQWLVACAVPPSAYLLIIFGQTLLAYRQKFLNMKRKKSAYIRALVTLNKLGSDSNLPLQEQSRMLCKIIVTFFAEKFNLTTEGITPPELRRLMETLNFPQEDIAKLVDIFSIHFNNSFSNTQEIKDVDDIERVKEIIRNILKNADSKVIK